MEVYQMAKQEEAKMAFAGYISQMDNGF